MSTIMEQNSQAFERSQVLHASNNSNKNENAAKNSNDRKRILDDDSDSEDMLRVINEEVNDLDDVWSWW